MAQDELLAQLWPQQFVSESVLTSCMLVVRQALGDSGQAQQVIKTVRGHGYRFLLPVEEPASLESALAPVASVPPAPTSAPALQPLPGLVPHLTSPPALYTAQTPVSHTPTLPGQLTSFVGRERDSTAAGQLLRRAEVRLLTLIGADAFGAAWAAGQATALEHASASPTM